MRTQTLASSSRTSGFIFSTAGVGARHRVDDFGLHRGVIAGRSRPDAAQRALDLLTGNLAPAVPLVAKATSEGYGGEHDAPQPFYGYFYRTLTAQAASAKGGAKNYIADGKMTSGFAFVAWPAQGHNSGVMTFVIDKDGVRKEPWSQSRRSRQSHELI